MQACCRESIHEVLGRCLGDLGKGGERKLGHGANWNEEGGGRLFAHGDNAQGEQHQRQAHDKRTLPGEKVFLQQGKIEHCMTGNGKEERPTEPFMHPLDSPHVDMEK